MEVEDYAKQISESLLVQEEELITEGLDFILGAGTWKFEDLQDRCTVDHSPDGRQVFSVDNNPLLEFFPIAYSCGDADDYTTFHASRQYRRLWNE